MTTNNLPKFGKSLKIHSIQSMFKYDIGKISIKHVNKNIYIVSFYSNKKIDTHFRFLKIVTRTNFVKNTNNNIKILKNGIKNINGIILKKTAFHNKKNTNNCLCPCPCINENKPIITCNCNLEGVIGCRYIHNQFLIRFPGVIPIYTSEDPFVIEGAELFFLP
jgi:hypothetical protein